VIATPRTIATVSVIFGIMSAPEGFIATGSSMRSHQYSYGKRPPDRVDYSPSLLSPIRDDAPK
jgi:hypothetical protein